HFGPRRRAGDRLRRRYLPALHAKPMSGPHAPDGGDAPRPASLMNRVVAVALGQRFIVVLLSVVLVIAGAWAWESLPMNAYPDLSPPMVDIVTQWPGHAAEEVERLITVPVERGMSGVPKMVVKR